MQAFADVMIMQVIKQAVVTSLGHHGIKKGDSDFTDFYQNIYRGVVFALVCHHSRSVVIF